MISAVEGRIDLTRMITPSRWTPTFTRPAVTTLALVVAIAVSTVACGDSEPEPAAEPMSSATLYEGFRLITGDDTALVDGAALLVDDGVIQAVGAQGSFDSPEGAARVDLSGKTVMPALVSLHGHLGFQVGLTYEAENYTRETLIDHLDRYAYYGVGTIVSLGTDGGDLIYALRTEQERGTLGGARVLTAGGGIARPNAGPGATAMRSSAIGVDDEEEARAAVRTLAERGVDVVKIWIDDRGGSVEKLSPELASAVIDEAHSANLQVIAHIFDAADAADAVEAGVNGFAHLARDEVISDELAAAMAAGDVFVMPNLGISERGIHTDPPAWLDDPLLHDSIRPEVIERAKGSFSSRSAEAAARAEQSWGFMQATLAKLQDAGVRLVLGADSGVTDSFLGYTELRELELMVNSGLTPAEAIMASTSVSADALGIDEAGLLTAGRSADFVVLDADPLEDITNARRIDRVFLKGVEVDREALRQRWAGE